MTRTKVAIIGSGNIGTDLMIKMLRVSKRLQAAALVGIDPASDGLARAGRMGVAVITDGVDGLISHPQFASVGIIMDATSAKAHIENAAKLAPYGKVIIDLTPAAIGPYVVPAVNLEEHLRAANLNMVTCGGQATIPVIAAVASVTPVLYAEIVASIASKSAGPGTRANIDEFTETTSAAIVEVGGAGHGKAIIVLNPAEPPLLMRDTVLCVTDPLDDSAREKVAGAIETMVADVAAYVPGYRLKQKVQFSELGADQPLRTLAAELEAATERCQVSVFLEVEGAADYLPAYSGNLDIMTSAAVRVAERIADRFADELDASPS
jgi:acetaldehyde dehydrogenase